MLTITVAAPGGYNMQETEQIDRAINATIVTEPIQIQTFEELMGLPRQRVAAKPASHVNTRSVRVGPPGTGPMPWQQDNLTNVLWHVAFFGILLLLGLMVWSSDTGRQIREELQTPNVHLPMVQPSGKAALPPEDPRLAEPRATSATRSVAVPRETVARNLAPTRGGVALPASPTTAAAAAATPTQAPVAPSAVPSVSVDVEVLPGVGGALDAAGTPSPGVTTSPTMLPTTTPSPSPSQPS